MWALRAIQWILAFLALVACNEAGAYIARETGVPVPGTVIGILIMLLALLLLRRVPEALQSASVYLLGHLNLFYVPAGVGVMGYLALVANDLWPIVITMFASTFLATIAAALAFQWVTRVMGKGDATPGGDA
jgi:holin-like protein